MPWRQSRRTPTSSARSLPPVPSHSSPSTLRIPSVSPLSTQPMWPSHPQTPLGQTQPVLAFLSTLLGTATWDTPRYSAGRQSHSGHCPPEGSSRQRRATPPTSPTCPAAPVPSRGAGHAGGTAERGLHQTSPPPPAATQKSPHFLFCGGPTGPPVFSSRASLRRPRGLLEALGRAQSTPSLPPDIGPDPQIPTRRRELSGSSCPPSPFGVSELSAPLPCRIRNASCRLCASGRRLWGSLRPRQCQHLQALS
mmetsp:Transcript_48294/g.95340  ORF Transcript_48294/g.95340 Transcript_48294/m.95340 type:complete len:251 (-) Transcript_48294:250-1002(-)